MNIPQLLDPKCLAYAIILHEFDFRSNKITFQKFWQCFAMKHHSAPHSLFTSCTGYKKTEEKSSCLSDFPIGLQSLVLPPEKYFAEQILLLSEQFSFGLLFLVSLLAGPKKWVDIFYFYHYLDMNILISFNGTWPDHI